MLNYRIHIIKEQGLALDTSSVYYTKLARATRIWSLINYADNVCILEGNERICIASKIDFAASRKTNETLSNWLRGHIAYVSYSYLSELTAATL